MNQVIPLPKGERNLPRVLAVLSSLSKEEDWNLTIEKAKPRRSMSQNAKLWAIYNEILKKSPEMDGWTKHDLHEFFLQNHFGDEVRNLFGKKKRVAMRRSSRLTKLEFMDLIESIYRFMAERGVFIQ